MMMMRSVHGLSTDSVRLEIDTYTP